MGVGTFDKVARQTLLGMLGATAFLIAGSAGAVAQDRILLLINGALGDKSFFDSASRGLRTIKET
jgi:basic membrane protein A